MAHSSDSEQLQEELADACKWGEEARARQLVARLATQPRKARALFEDMLSSPDARRRQAAAFGLGELGGPASARCLAAQLAREEARGDHDGASVIEAITDALGRIDEASARAGLARRLARLSPKAGELSDLNSLARALWRRRHPELIGAVQQALRRLELPSANDLQGLLVLLEKSPRELRAWAEDPAVALEDKRELLTVLEEDLPDELLGVLPAFISVARGLEGTEREQGAAASSYCDRLFILLLMHEERALATLPPEARAELRAVARTRVAGKALGCAVRAAELLKAVGAPEDAPLLEAHRPAEPVLARVFDEAAQALRALGGPSPTS